MAALAVIDEYLPVTPSLFSPILFAGWPLLAGVLLTIAAGPAAAAPTRPNILVLWHDGISPAAISAYGHGVVGEQTPRIDGLAATGTAMTDAYGEVTAAAAQAAFLTGRYAVRTGLAGAAAGASRGDPGLTRAQPTLARLLRALGYATGRFGLDRVGVGTADLGFDNFYGAVLPVATSPGAPGELQLGADTGADTGANDSRLPPVLHLQRQPDGSLQRDPVGRLDARRRAGLDAETAARALTFIEQQQAAGRPWFVWWSAVGAQVPAEDTAAASLPATTTPLGIHDAQVGQFLERLEQLGIAADTLVLYVGATGIATAGATAMLDPFDAPPASGEGGYRVPLLVRWPARVPGGVWRNDPVHLLDALPTLLAAAGEPDLPALLATGIALQPEGAVYRAHLDGVNQLPLLRGDAARGARQALLYWSADGLPIALRVDDWKLTFAVPVAAAAPAWAQPLAALRAPLLVNLRQQPSGPSAFDATRADEWRAAHGGLLAVARAHLQALQSSLQTFAPEAGEALAGIDWMLERLGP
ncbi:MAG: hypothetical protein EA400_02330 [Chromatiaceae bacterium]|nr:MAG: hypothetical protein EA400_02330 [Chromatiaceae bacterium]